jgi:hypothetical protein
VRKPVQFGFVDFRRREARRLDCEREVRLNRRLAPDVYLGVADVVLEGEPVDHMVVMRRMPEGRRLARLARRRVGLDGCLHQVAGTLAEFHAGADRSPDISAAGSGEAQWAAWQANFAETAPFVGTVLDESTEEEIRRLAERWTSGRHAVLDRRIEEGRVCDGHGDLQAEDIFCLDDGVRILDCIEFSDRLRYGDVCADAAFLAMDLERLGRADAAVRFLADYQDLAGDHFPDVLVHYYCASRAYVRAKVCCLRYEQGDREADVEARQLQELARRHLRDARVRMVLVGGLPGSGKTTVAAGIGAATGWPVLSTDEVRRQTFPTEGGPPGGHLGGRYDPVATQSVYLELLRRAEHSLASGESVVLDASWTGAERRRAARALADRTRSDLVELRCEAAPVVEDRRIARRLSRGTGPSEATPEVRAAMARATDPWPSAATIDTTGTTPEQAVGLALEALSQV